MPEISDAPPQDQSAAALQAAFDRGVTLHQQGKLAEAEAIYRATLRERPDHFGALHMLAVIALQTGHAEQAIKMIAKSIELKGDVASAYSNLAKGLLELKRSEEALLCCDKAISLDPNFAMAYNNRSNALLDLKRSEEALESCDRAIALDPKLAMVHNNRGLALNNLGRHLEALESCDRAVELNPSSARAYNNRGNALLGLFRQHEALASYDRSVALDPSYAMAHKNRATALEKFKRYEEAFHAYDKAYALEPGLSGAAGDRLDAKLRICDWSDYDAECKRLTSSVNSGTAPFIFLTIPATLDDQLQCAKSWIAKECPPAAKPVWQGERYKHDRIRVAYLSPDFREHATSFLMAGMLECHDKSRFDICALACGPDDNSAMRKRIAGAVERFIDTKSYSDERLAQLTREMEIDIFVDLAAFTANARTRVFAKRPAPIQVNYLGYPGTMGAPYIDYIIADRFVIPAEQRGFYSEKIAYLPNSYQVNDRERPIADREFTRAEVGLTPAGFVFCCFNNNGKIKPPIFDSWMRILNQVEGSVLWLLEDSELAAANLKKEAAARGMNPKRLVFGERMPMPDHLARHRLADLFLDTLPYNAHTTASDALWTGLPVLTCLGDKFAGRVAASLLNAVGLPELIVPSMEAYERMAIDLAAHPEKLAAIKNSLAENRLTTPLFDTRLFTNHMEAAYAAMHERYQAGLPPDHIAIAN